MSTGCAIYAWSELELPENRWGSMTQIQVAEVVLRELGKPVDALTLLGEMEKRGWKAESSAKVVRESLERNLSKKPDAFVPMGDCWFARSSIEGGG